MTDPLVPTSAPISYFDFPKPGSQITISYPKKNRHYFGRDPRRFRAKAMIERTIVILSVEDGRYIPITLTAFLRRPTVRRGRWRIIAWDPTKRDLRTFYPDFNEPCRLQLGLWDPKSGACIKRIGEIYDQTAEGLLELKGACEEILKEPPPLIDAPTLAIYAAA